MPPSRHPAPPEAFLDLLNSHVRGAVEAARRRGQRISQRSLAADLGVSRATLRRWLSGGSAIGAGDLARLCDLLELSAAARAELLAAAGHAWRAEEAASLRTTAGAPAPTKLINAASTQSIGMLSGGLAVGVMLNSTVVNTPPASEVALPDALALLARMPTADGAPLPEPAPLPAPHHMPLTRNPLFVGREHDLRALARALAGEGQVTAIGQTAASTGLGGIGKTNLATEFVHRYGQFFAGGVFWLSFAEASQVTAEVARCGPTGLVAHYAWRELAIEEQAELVRRAWQSPLPRLLVFDNCEDEALLRAWRPTSGCCRVLITSRRDGWSPALGVAQLRLETLPRQESVALLRKHRPDIGAGDAVLDALAAELGDLPLALHLAGSYLAAYARDAVLGDARRFLAELRGRAVLAHEALEGVETAFSPTNHLLHVARTFSLSYERLDPAAPADALARATLACAACLAPGEPIPHEMLLACVLEGEDDPARRDAVRGIRRLCEVGLLEEVAGGALRMHRLVRRFTERVSDMAAAHDAVERMVVELCDGLQQERNSNAIQAVRVHLRTVVDYALEHVGDQVTRLCNQVGLCLGEISAYHEAQELFEQALELLSDETTTNADQRATTLQNLGATLWRMGLFGQAQSYVEGAVSLREAQHGPDHESVASALGLLALVLEDRGEYERARALYERALQISEQALGPEHPTVSTRLNNLAGLLETLGDYDAARMLLERALQIADQTLGPTHPDTATRHNNLANLYVVQGNYDDARPLYERALEISEHTLGPSHPDTARSLGSLATLLQMQGDFDGARSLYERALQIAEQTLGQAHPDTARYSSTLGMLLYLMGDYSGARPPLERALQISEHALGPVHPDTATILGGLSAVLLVQGEHRAAQLLLERAVQIAEEVLGPTHPQTAQQLMLLGTVLNALGEISKARLLVERALEVTEHVFGPDHAQTAECLLVLATVLQAEGEHDRAVSLLQRALVISEQALGPAHHHTAMCLYTLAILRARQRAYGEARPLLERALRIQSEALGLDHPHRLQTLQNLAELLDEQGDQAALRRLIEDEIALRERANGPDDPEVAQLRAALAQLAEQGGEPA